MLDRRVEGFPYGSQITTLSQLDRTGTSGQILTAQGVGSAPKWAAGTGLPAIPYNLPGLLLGVNTSDASAFLRQGLKSQVIQASGGSAVAYGYSTSVTFTAATASGTNFDSDGDWVELNTNSSVGNAVSIQGDGTANLPVRYQTKCVFSSVIKPVSTANVRIWVGVANGGAGSITGSSDPKTLSTAFFRYDTGVDGTAFWRTYTSNGTNSTVTTTTLAFAASKYILEIDLTSTSQVVFYVNGSAVATHTTNLPAATAQFIPTISMTQLAGISALSINFGMMSITGDYIWQ